MINQEKNKNNKTENKMLAIMLILFGLFLSLVIYLLHNSGFSFFIQRKNFLVIIIWIWLFISLIILVFWKKIWSQYQLLFKLDKTKWFVIYIIISIFVIIMLGNKIFDVNKISKQKNDKFKSFIKISSSSMPHQVDCYGKKSIIKIKVFNHTKNPLSYSDIKEGKYQIKICREDDQKCFLVNKKSDMILNDFVVINPNETKTIIINLGFNGKRNIFAVKKDKQNKKYNYHIELVKINPNHQETIVASTPKFEVLSNVMIKNGEDKIKTCS